MFPISGELIASEVENPSKSRKTFKFDYKSNRFALADGRLVEINDETEKVRQWVELLLKTDFNKFKVYRNTDFGLDKTEVIGLKNVDNGLTNALLEQEIKEKVKLNPLISEVNNFNFKQVNQELRVEFTIILKSGGELNVASSRD